MTSLNDSAMRNMPGTVPPPALLLLLLSGQPTSFLKLLRRLGQMGVGVDMLTCVFKAGGSVRQQVSLPAAAGLRECLCPGPGS